MITSLTQITMAQYVDILCGDINVLTQGENAAPEEIEAARTALVAEYASIADPAGTAAYIGEQRDGGDAKATLSFFTLCSNLIAMKAYEDVKGLLEEYGLHVRWYTDKRLSTEVDRRLKRAKSIYERSKIDTPDEKRPLTDIRSQFDRQAAALMTYFKFQIDLSTIKASVFAYMIAQCDREVRARHAAMANR